MIMEESDERSLIVLNKKTSVDSSGLLKSKLQHLKGEYKKWKQQLLYQWTKHNLLSVLETGEQLDLMQTEKDLKSTRLSMDEAKSDLQDIIVSLQELVEQADICFKEYEDRSNLLNQERKNYEDLVERHKLATAKLRDTATRSGLDSSIKEKERRLAELQFALDGMNHSITRLESDVQASRTENTTLQEVLASLQEQIRTQQQSLEAASDESNAQRKWLENYVAFLREISGIKKVETDGRKFCVWLSAADDNDSDDLCITMIFGCNSKDKARLQSAEVSDKLLEVDDIIETAVLRDETPYLIGEIKKRWNSPLYKEVEKLRNEYALDWLNEERIVKVIFGDDAHIICTLYISAEYPSDGSVQLKSVEGIQDGPDPSTIKVPTASAQVTLTEWLQYLNDYFKEK